MNSKMLGIGPSVPANLGDIVKSRMQAKVAEHEEKQRNGKGKDFFEIENMDNLSPEEQGKMNDMIELYKEVFEIKSNNNNDK